MENNLKEENKRIEELAHKIKDNSKQEKEKFIIDNGHIFSKLSLDELYKYMIILKVNFKTMHNAIATYKREISNDISDKKDLVYNQKYDLPLIEELMDDFIANSKSKTELIKKYGITEGTLITYMKRIEEYAPNKFIQVNYAMNDKLAGYWKTNYNMNPNYSWERDYFKKMIGGLKTTIEEKEKCLKIINDAIEKNNKGEITELNKEIILKSYPESIDLLKDYYDSLIHAHNKDDDNDNEVDWKEILIKDRNTMLMVYAPHLATLSLEELGKYTKMYNISMRNMIDLINNYKKIFLSNNKYNLDKENLTILKQIAYDVLENNYKKVDLDKKYNLSTSTFDKYMEQLKNIDTELYNKVKEKLTDNSRKHFYMMKELIEKLYEFIVNGINTGDKKTNFTMLDYYSLTSYNTKIIVDFLNNNVNNPDIRQYRGRIVGFISRAKNVGAFESPESFAKKNIVFGINGTEVKFDYDNSKQIIDYLKENKIPTNYKNVYTAAYRYARGENILPLKNTEQNTQEVEENTKQESGVAVRELKKN